VTARQRPLPKRGKNNPSQPMSSIEHLPTQDLIPHVRNSRTHSEAQVAQIAGSIREFGFTNPVLIDANGTIIAGHGRVLAARKLAMPSVPCLRLGHLTQAQVRAYVIADNKLALNAGWDEDMLRAEIEALKLDGFDSGQIGFSDDELAALLAQTANAGQTDPNDVPELPQDAVTRLGDVWIIGAHRITCGDSSDPRVISALIKDDPIACAVVDPPYELKESVWSKWIMDPCIVFGQAKHIRMIPDKLWRFERIIVKRHKHRSATVQVRHSHAFVAQCGTVKKLPDNKKITLASVIEQEQDTEHDHQKPATLLAEHLEHWTPMSAGWVIDPFSGSGSTIIACEMTGRVAAACELNPPYVDIAVERWQKFTGKQAVLESTGQTYDELKGNRPA
jgi:hypothetical protein